MNNRLYRIQKLLYPIIFLSLQPSLTYGLTGGPTMPEYVQFEPYDVSDVVDLKSGDFTFSVPLGDVPGPGGGYPLSMSYHSGIGGNQEATYVGLGWSLNPGAINRTLRTYPDDIHNGATLSYMYLRGKKEGSGANIGAGWGPVGLNMEYSTDKGFGGGVILGFNYGGMSVGVEIGTEGVGLNVGVGIIQASVDKEGVSVGLNVGNGGSGSRFAFEGSMGVHMSWSKGLSMEAGVGLNAYPIPGHNKSTSVAGFSMNSSNRNGGSFTLAGTGFATQTATGNGVQNSLSISGYGGTIPLPYGFWVSLGYNHYEQNWWLTEATKASVYGYMYQGGQAVKIGGSNEIPVLVPFAIGAHAASVSNTSSVTNFNWTNAGSSLEMLAIDPSEKKPDHTGTGSGNEPNQEDLWIDAPSYDAYAVSAQGMSGVFRPQAKSKMRLYEGWARIYEEDPDLTRQQFLLEPNEYQNQKTVVFKNSEQWTSDDIYFVDNGSEDEALPTANYYFCNDGKMEWGTVRDHRQEALDEFSRRLTDSNNENDCSPYAFLKSNLINQENRLVISRDQRNRFRAPAQTNMRFAFINDLGKLDKYNFDDTLYWSAGGRQIIPLLEDADASSLESGGRLKGFKIVDVDGKQYFFEKPVYSLLQIDYSTQQPKGMPSFDRSSTDTYNWSVQMTPYATQWLVTEIRGADFLEINSNDMKENYGYQVKFHYKDPVRYNWRAPYATPGTPIDQLQNMRLGQQKKYIASMGQKELIYPDYIETATHEAKFNLNDPVADERQDSREWKTDWLGNSTTPPPLEVPVTTLFEYKEGHFRACSGTEYTDPFDFPGFDIHLMRKYRTKHELTHIYLPFRPTPDQVLRIKANGLQLSEIDVAFSYALKQPSYQWETDEWLADGPFIKIPSSSLNFTIVDIVPTSGAAESYGPYEVIVQKSGPLVFDTDIFTYESPVEGGVNCDDDPGEDVNKHPPLNTRGKVLIGAGSLWEYGVGSSKQWLRMTAQARGDAFKRSVNPDAHPDYMPKISKLSLMPIYANNPSKNQQRKLNSIDIVYKPTGAKLRTFDFTYDYSMCRRTPNSFSGSVYPSTVDGLNGKLTLRKVTESGYDPVSGEAHSLPPWEFDYQNGNDFYTGGNPNFLPWPDNLATTGTDFENYVKMIPEKTDEWGMFNPFGDQSRSQKVVNNSNKGVTWNLQEITNPLGGKLFVKYGRDTYTGMSFNPPLNAEDKPFAFNLSTGGEFRTYTEGGLDYIKMTPFPEIPSGVTPDFDYFRELTREEVLNRYRFDGFEQLAVGDPVAVLIKTRSTFKDCPSGGCDFKRASVYFTAVTSIRKKLSDGDYVLNLTEADFPSLDGAPPSNFIEKTVDKWLESNGDHGVHNWGANHPRLAAVFKLAPRMVNGGNIRVEQLSSCFLDCRTTAYSYENGAVPVLPDSILSDQWLVDNVYANQTTTDGERTVPGIRITKGASNLGKNLLPTEGRDLDIPFLPGSMLNYGKVTVTNIDKTKCEEPSSVEGCISSGKIVYKFWTANDFLNPIYPSTGQLFKNHVESRDNANGAIQLSYRDYTSILGMTKSVTYYGSERTGSVYKYYMVSKDSSEYQFQLDRQEKDSWISEKHYNSSQSYSANVDYYRVPVSKAREISFNFGKRVFDEENVMNVDHLQVATTFDQLDPLTGTALRSYSEYKDANDPRKTRKKQTSTSLIAGLGQVDQASLPKDMRRRNMLIQPYSEKVEIFTNSSTTRDSLLNIKFTRWDNTNPSHPNFGVNFKASELVPTFNLNSATGTDPIGNPALFYSTGYDLSRWRGDRITKIDNYSHAIEATNSAGTPSTISYSRDGLYQTGYVVNSYERTSRNGQISANPLQNNLWTFTGGAVYENGNFSLPKPAPTLVRIASPFPIQSGGNYTISIRAKSRSLNTTINLDFESDWTVSGENFSAIGAQQSIVATPQWQEFTISFNSFPQYTHANAFLNNKIRVSNSNNAQSGLEYDVVVDYIKVTSSTSTPTIFVGNWKIDHGKTVFQSNPNAIYSSSGTGTCVIYGALALDNAINSDLYLVEFKARANQDNMPLQVDFICGATAGCEGDQKEIILSHEWKKYKVTLDRRIYQNSSSYASNFIRFFSDSKSNGEIELEWARAYPKGAMANTMVRDVKGNVREFIDENNQSTYFDYDAFGKLTGVKNEAGYVVTEQYLNYGKK